MVEAILEDYINNPNLAILYFLRETADQSGFGEGASRKCDLIGDEPTFPPSFSWGDEGREGFPLMVSVVLNHGQGLPNMNEEIISWFDNWIENDNDSGISPWFVFLDEDFYIVSVIQDKYEIENHLDALLND